MRVLGIETSSRRGTVALVDGDSVVAVRTSDEPLHGERVLPLLSELFASVGWVRSQVDLIAAGVGPGSFTGLRIGVALAQGLGLGLGRPVVGVGALRAMCFGASPRPGIPDGPRCALVDARRTELFAGVYGADGAELVAPCVVARPEFLPWLLALPAGARPAVLVGEVAAELAASLPGFPGELLAAAGESTDWTGLPHAACVALAGRSLCPELHPPEPAYVRPPDAIRPHLPRSPLSSAEPR